MSARPCAGPMLLEPVLLQRGRLTAMPIRRDAFGTNGIATNTGRNIMARRDSHPEVSRRKFLAGAAVAGAAASTTVANAATPPTGAARIPSAVRPTAHQVALEANVVTEVKPIAGRAGSDFMVDVIKSLDIDSCYSNPASSFRGLHESLINYGKNTKPEFITCMH